MYAPIPRILSILLSCIAMHVLAGCSAQSDSSVYIESGLSLHLPNNWEVFEDHQGTAHYRSVSIATHAGSIVTLDIYKHTDESQPEDLRAYLGKYIELALPEEVSDKAQLDYGEAYQGGLRGMFVKIAIPEPVNLHYLIEVYPKQTRDRTAYITFNTPADLANKIQPHINKFLKNVSLN